MGGLALGAALVLFTGIDADLGMVVVAGCAAGSLPIISLTVVPFTYLVALREVVPHLQIEDLHIYICSSADISLCWYRTLGSFVSITAIVFGILYWMVIGWVFLCVSEVGL